MDAWTAVRQTEQKDYFDERIAGSVIAHQRRPGKEPAGDLD
jgi:hypothetical protein